MLNMDLPPDKGIYYDEDTTKYESRAKTIGRILRQLRKNTKATQNEIATKIGIAQQTYQGYESGKHEPSIELIIRLADIYEVTLDYITGRHFGIDRYEEYELAMESLAEALPHIQMQLALERNYANTMKQYITRHHE